jgi:desulfoferrodoxin (superoxide reductase-like protein)
MKIFPLALLTVVTVFVSACVPTDRESNTPQPGEVPFHSAVNPGVWESQVADHEPVVTVTDLNDRKVLNVQVPFSQKRDHHHYVEAILLLDQKRKELQKKTFDSGSGAGGAVFELPGDYNSRVYVVVKCNLHDMWEKPVDWSE